MPSTRKQKAKERRSRQFDMLSDVENVDIMLRSYSRDDEENLASKNEVNLDSGSSRPQQNSNVIGEVFRSLLNTNSRENSETTIETTRMISEDISNQMSRKLNEIINSLKSQIQEAINNVMTERVLPSIQNTLGTHGNVNYTTMGQASVGPHRSPRATNFVLRDHLVQWATAELRSRKCTKIMGKLSQEVFYPGKQQTNVSPEFNRL